MASLLAFFPIALLAIPAAADSMSSFETVCNRSEADTPEEPTCVWSEAVGCDACDGVCVAEAPESNVQVASMAATLSMTACTALATLINGISRQATSTSGDSEFGAVTPATNCPENEDITTHFEAAITSMNEDSAAIEVINLATSDALASADDLIRYISVECTDQSIDGETSVCINSAQAILAEATRQENIATKCAAAVELVEHGECLTLGALTHIDKECLMSHGVSTVDDATATEITTAFSGLHTACSAITTEAACTGAAAQTQVTAAIESVADVELPEDFTVSDATPLAVVWAFVGAFLAATVM